MGWKEVVVVWSGFHLRICIEELCINVINFLKEVRKVTCTQSDLVSSTVSLFCLVISPSHHSTAKLSQKWDDDHESVIGRSPVIYRNAEILAKILSNHVTLISTLPYMWNVLWRNVIITVLITCPTQYRPNVTACLLIFTPFCIRIYVRTYIRIFVYFKIYCILNLAV
jgi:hypothetical protein